MNINKYWALMFAWNINYHSEFIDSIGFYTNNLTSINKVSNVSWLVIPNWPVDECQYATKSAETL